MSGVRVPRGHPHPSRPSVVPPYPFWPSPLEGEGFRAADSRPYEETRAFRNIGRGRSQTGPRAATWGRPYWVTFSQRKAFGRPQGSPLRISKNGGRVWDPPLQKTKPFRVCRRGRTLAGPPGNGRRLGRAARCAAPTKKRERSEISVGAGPRPARGRPHGAAPTGSPSPKGRLSGDRKGRPYVFPKTAGGSGTRPYKRQNRFGYAVGAGYWPARPGMGDG